MRCQGTGVYAQIRAYARTQQRKRHFKSPILSADIMGCIRVILGLACLIVRIGGTSDGSAALFIYVGAFFGLGGAGVLLMRRSQDG